MKIKIEKNIDMAKKDSISGDIKKMDIGDSFVYDKPLASIANVAYRLGYKLASRKQEQGLWRIWRTK